MKNINIPEPCTENWNEMTPNEKGAYCGKCAMDVHDFTNKSGDQIRDILAVNVGSRVCGHINKHQLDELNSDFLSWKMDNKQTFQRAWLFTLIAVFGMTLFSCEEDDEPVVENIQKIGKVVLSDVESATTEADTVNLKTNQDIITNDDVVLPIRGEVEYCEPSVGVIGKMIYQPEPIEPVKEVPIPIEIEDSPVLYDGGMVSSIEFDRYLVDRTSDLVAKGDPSDVMTGIIYPNPARNETTFKLTMPKRGKGDIELLGLSGQKIRTIHSGRLKKGETEFQIDLTDLEAGLYLIVIYSNGIKETVQFSKI